MLVKSRISNLRDRELFNLLATSPCSATVRRRGWEKGEFVKAVVSIAMSLIGRGTAVCDRAEALARPEPASSPFVWNVNGSVAGARDYWLDQSVTIVGNGAQSETYAEALSALGQSPRMIDATHVTLAGLKSAYRHITEDTA